MRLVPVMRGKLLILGKMSALVIHYKPHTLTCKHVIVLYICSKSHREYCAGFDVEVNATLMVKDLELWLRVGRVSGSVIEREITWTSGLGRIMISVFIPKSCLSCLYIILIIVVSIVPKTSSSFLVFFPDHFCPSFSTNTKAVRLR